MKYIFTLLLFISISFAQFKEDVDKSELIKNSLYTEGPSGFFTNFLSSENFQMKHTLSMSYTAGGGQGVALGIYTNSMMFKIADNIDLQVDASFVNSPYNSLGKEFTDGINGVYISNARLDYKISDKTSLTLQYRNLPYNYGYRYGYGYDYGYNRNFYRGFRNSWFRDSFLND